MTDNRYHNSKVYKLIDDDGYYYYGSTCVPLHKRRWFHQDHSKRKPQRKIYTIFTYERFLKGEIKIVLVEELKLENKEQLLRAENNYIQKSLDDTKCLNCNCSFLSREDCLLKKKKWHENNKEYIAVVNKLRYDKKKDHDLEMKKRYYKNNKTKINDNHKIYYQQNLERIKHQQMSIEVCECGSKITHINMPRHQKSLKHLNYINNNKIE